MNKDIYDVVIVGGGPSGLSCGIYTSRSLLKTLIISSSIIPAQAVLTDIIENYPGFVEGINGFDFVEKLKQQATKFGCEIISGDVVNIIKNDGFELKLTNSEVESVKTKAVVVATGRRNKNLGLQKELSLVGKGVSYCAVCDAFLYKDKTVALIGGGDTAFTEAIYISKLVRKLYLVHRRKQFRATKILQQRLFEKDNVEILVPYVVENILGEERLLGIMIKNVETNEIKQLQCDGVFVCIGYLPNTEFVRNLLTVDTEGYIITDENMRTSIDGIFACGDCRSGSVKQVITSAAEGVISALSVIEFIEKNK
ncbi:MAG: thioredoxin-disulfide reductase [Endomicrobiia bacterium]